MGCMCREGGVGRKGGGGRWRVCRHGVTINMDGRGGGICFTSWGQSCVSGGLYVCRCVCGYFAFCTIEVYSSEGKGVEWGTWRRKVEQLLPHGGTPR